MWRKTSTFFLALTWLRIGAQDFFILCISITTTKRDILKVERPIALTQPPTDADVMLLLWNTCLFQSFNSKAIKLGIGNVSEHTSEQLTSRLASVRTMELITAAMTRSVWVWSTITSPSWRIQKNSSRLHTHSYCYLICPASPNSLHQFQCPQLFLSRHHKFSVLPTSAHPNLDILVCHRFRLVCS